MSEQELKQKIMQKYDKSSKEGFLATQFYKSKSFLSFLAAKTRRIHTDHLNENGGQV